MVSSPKNHKKKDISEIRCVQFLVSSAEYFPPFCIIIFSISFLSSDRNKQNFQNWGKKSTQIACFAWIPPRTLVTQMVNPAKGRTLKGSWGTIRCSIQHWCNQSTVTIGFFKTCTAHCIKIEENKSFYHISQFNILYTFEKLFVQ